jgi:two-component system nitrate/nitrite response regulator NarL
VYEKLSVFGVCRKQAEFSAHHGFLKLAPGALNLSTQIRVLISDSTKMHCELLRKAFGPVRHKFEVSGFVSSAAEVLAACHQHRPQVAVISSDLQNGPMSGLMIVPEIRITYSETKIIVVIGSQNKDLVVDAFRLGAVGVFNRNSPFDMLCKSIEMVARGQVWANAEELHRVLKAFAKTPKPPKLDPLVEGRVTRREAAVVRLAVEGLSNREIAQQMALTEHTVKNYLFRVFDKIGVSNRVELVLSCIHREEHAREELASGKTIASQRVLSSDK